VSFFYNGRLPWYAWGHVFLGNGSSAVGGHTYQQRGDFLHLNVPLEGNARPSWEAKPSQTGVIASKAPFEGAPCDAQLPWKAVSITDSRQAMLTLNGEVYTFNNTFNSTFFAGLSSYLMRGQIARWKSPLVQKPIKFLAYKGPQALRIVDDVQRFDDIGLVIDTDGKAWWAQTLVRTFFPLNQRVQRFDQTESVSTPAGTTAKFIHWGAFSAHRNNPSDNERYMYVLTTEDDQTYIRRTDETDWIKLSGGCVIPNITYPANATPGEWNTNALPTLTVSAPGGGGVTAEIAYSFEAVSGTRSRLSKVVISNPGSGYTSDATVAFSVAPVQFTEPTVTLSVFNDSVVSVHENLSPVNSLKNFVFLTASGKTCHLIRFVHEPTNNDFGTDGKWVDYIELLDRTFTNPKNAIAFSGRNYYFPSEGSRGAGYIPCDTFIGTDKKLYKYNTQTVVPTAAPGYEVVDNGPWGSLAFCGNTFCGVKEDGTMYTWGQNSAPSSSGYSYSGTFFGDESAVGVTRTPTQIASQCDWLQVFAVSGSDNGFQGFIAIRKDAICREIDQPMEYFPDWHYQTQT